MFIRPKSFLIYLVICLAPLLLLTAVSYWNAIRVIDTAVGGDLQDHLNSFTSGIDDILRDQEKEVMKLALAQPVRQFVATKKNANQSFLFSPDMKVPAEDRDSLPSDLQTTIGDVLNRSGHLISLALFDRNERPLLVAERASRSEMSPPIFRTNDFSPGQPRPDERVWGIQGNVLLTKSITLAPAGASLQYTVPIFDEARGSTIAALVGVLALDPVFSRTAGVLETSANGDNSTNSMVIVLDASGKILYHSNNALKYQPVSTAMPAFLPIAKAMIADNSGAQSFRLPGGQDYLATIAPMPRLDVAVAVMRDRSQLIASVHRSSAIVLLLSCVVGLGVALLLEKHVQRKSRGIERVTKDLTAIAKGELDRRIELKSSDDARGLADSINVVTERLRTQIAREAESRQFDSFVRLSAMLTHDLKNAIESLSLTVGNMERHFDNADFRVDAMKSLTAATDKLKGLVTRLSKPVTTLSGEHKRPLPTDLVPIFKRVVAMTAEPLREKHTIIMKLPDTLLALTDTARIEKVIENLVLNALEAMNEKSGSLTIEAAQATAGAVAFSISDTGPGMSRHFIENRLFRPFATTKRTGVGLGLYTCREVLKASGGSIEVQSIEGAGTTFRVMLPSAPTDRRN